MLSLYRAQANIRHEFRSCMMHGNLYRNHLRNFSIIQHSTAFDNFVDNPDICVQLSANSIISMFRDWILNQPQIQPHSNERYDNAFRILSNSLSNDLVVDRVFPIISLNANKCPTNLLFSIFTNEKVNGSIRINVFVELLSRLHSLDSSNIDLLADVIKSNKYPECPSNSLSYIQMRRPLTKLEYAHLSLIHSNFRAPKLLFGSSSGPFHSDPNFFDCGFRDRWQYRPLPVLSPTSSQFLSLIKRTGRHVTEQNGSTKNKVHNDSSTVITPKSQSVFQEPALSEVTSSVNSTNQSIAPAMSSSMKNLQIPSALLSFSDAPQPPTSDILTQLLAIRNRVAPHINAAEFNSTVELFERLIPVLMEEKHPRFLRHALDIIPSIDRHRNQFVSEASNCFKRIMEMVPSWTNKFKPDLHETVSLLHSVTYLDPWSRLNAEEATMLVKASLALGRDILANHAADTGHVLSCQAAGVTLDALLNVRGIIFFANKDSVKIPQELTAALESQIRQVANILSTALVRDNFGESYSSEQFISFMQNVWNALNAVVEDNSGGSCGICFPHLVHVLLEASSSLSSTKLKELRRGGVPATFGRSLDACAGNSLKKKAKVGDISRSTALNIFNVCSVVYRKVRAAEGMVKADAFARSVNKATYSWLRHAETQTERGFTLLDDLSVGLKLGVKGRALPNGSNLWLDTKNLALVNTMELVALREVLGTHKSSDSNQANVKPKRLSGGLKKFLEIRTSASVLHNGYHNVTLSRINFDSKVGPSASFPKLRSISEALSKSRKVITDEIPSELPRLMMPGQEVCNQFGLSHEQVSMFISKMVQQAAIRKVVTAAGSHSSAATASENASEGRLFNELSRLGFQKVDVELEIGNFAVDALLEVNMGDNRPPAILAVELDGPTHYAKDEDQQDQEFLLTYDRHGTRSDFLTHAIGCDCIIRICSMKLMGSLTRANVAKHLLAGVPVGSELEDVLAKQMATSLGGGYSGPGLKIACKEFRELLIA